MDNTLTTFILQSLLSKKGAEVYYFLVNNGSSRVEEIYSNLDMHYTEAYSAIKNLANKGLCDIIPENPIKCSAISGNNPIMLKKDSVISTFVNIYNQIKNQPFTKHEHFDEEEYPFWIIYERKNVEAKIKDFISNANKSLSIVCSPGSLCRLVAHKDLLKQAANKNVKISIMGEVTEKITETINSLNFCNINNISNGQDIIISKDNKESLVIYPIPDDAELFYGKDIGIYTPSKSISNLIKEL